MFGNFAAKLSGGCPREAFDLLCRTRIYDHYLLYQAGKFFVGAWLRNSSSRGGESTRAWPRLPFLLT